MDADELAEAHWGYIKNLLIVTAYTGEPIEYDQWIEQVEFHYKTAFIHGFKHGVENENTRLRSMPKSTLQGENSQDGKRHTNDSPDNGVS